MRRRALLLATVLLPPLALAALLLAALDRRPLVERDAGISPQSVAQAKDLFRANDPRRLAAGEEKTVVLPASLLDEGINHLAGRLLRGRASLALGEGESEVRLSLPLPETALFLNLRARFREDGEGLRIAAAGAGRLPLPAVLVEALVRAAVERAGYGREWALAQGAVRHLDFRPEAGAVAVTYVWTPEILARARSLVLPPAEVARLETARRDLAALLAPYPARAKVPLPDVLRGLLAGDDSRERRRAALLVLALHLAGKDLAALAPQARHWPQPQALELTLGGRYDSAQHFVVSATLAAWAGEPLADAVGLYKELDDARHGSGFSFADLAADRAGTRFGQLVTAGDARLEELLARPLGGEQLLPRLDGLPEYLAESEFRRRFSAPGSLPYQQLVADIESRLTAMPLYR